MTMVVDGKSIARKVSTALRRAIAKDALRLGLSIVVVGDDPVSATYVRQKQKFAEELGIQIFLHELVEEDGEGPVEKALLRDAKDPEIHGMILQLPLPDGWNRDTLIGLIPKEKDIDVLTRGALAEFRDEKFPVLPPVVGAIQEILETHKIPVAQKDVLVIGRGRLVGQPVSLWFRHNDAHVTMVGDEVRDLKSLTQEADIIVSGTGVPKLITPDMISPDCVLLDAGTSEDGGVLLGDADPKCAGAAHLFSPVPGGIGPITAAMLMKNLYVLGTRKA